MVRRGRSGRGAARRIRNPDLGAPGMELLRHLDVVDRLARISCPTLVCAGRLNPVTPVAAAQEIAGALPPGVGRLAVVEGRRALPLAGPARRVLAAHHLVRGPAEVNLPAP